MKISIEKTPNGYQVIDSDEGALTEGTYSYRHCRHFKKLEDVFTEIKLLFKVRGGSDG